MLLAYYASKAPGIPFPDTGTPDPGCAPSVDPGDKNKPKEPCSGNPPVIGHYPEYKDLADELGAGRFDLDV